MKLTDLRPCDRCDGPIGVVFFRVSVEQHVVDLNEARRHMGLTAMLGGSSQLASVMGTDSDESTKVATKRTLLLCPACFCEPGGVPVAMERPDKAKAVRP